MPGFFALFLWPPSLKFLLLKLPNYITTIHTERVLYVGVVEGLGMFPAYLVSA